MVYLNQRRRSDRKGGGPRLSMTAPRRTFGLGGTPPAVSGQRRRFMTSSGRDAALQALAAQIIACALALHRRLGPCLPASTYAACLAHELGKQGLNLLELSETSLNYSCVRIAEDHRSGLLVNDSVIVEFKGVSKLQLAHSIQLMTYLRLSGKPLGLLMNVHAPRLEYGIRWVEYTPPAMTPRRR
jgi:GxxExxY protein